MAAPFHSMGIEPSEILVRAHEPFLRYVLGQPRIAHDEVGRAERDLLVPLDEHTERLAVALARRSHHRNIVSRSVHLHVIHPPR